MRRCVILLGFCVAAAGADAERGAQVLQRENCLHCHALRGEGGNLAPDLSRRTAHGYTPATLASMMWNHAPAMWAEISAQKLPLPQLSPADAEDLFAYLYSMRYFERPGDAGRGKQLFLERHCAECHSLDDSGKGPGAPVSKWKSLSDPMALVQQMWNHSSAMKSELAQRKKVWVALTGPELNDLTVYLQNFPVGRKAPPQFTLPPASEGKALFDASCAQCHKASLSLDRRLNGMTLTDVAASMWNHVPRMLAVPVIEEGDMARIVAYVWQSQYLGPSGNVGRGRKTFEEKKCASCHDPGGVAAGKFVRGERVLTPLSMISALWSHGPQMEAEMKSRGIAWPRLAPDDVSNLVSYLNTRP